MQRWCAVTDPRGLFQLGRGRGRQGRRKHDRRSPAALREGVRALRAALRDGQAHQGPRQAPRLAARMKHKRTEASPASGADGSLPSGNSPPSVPTLYIEETPLTRPQWDKLKAALDRELGIGMVDLCAGEEISLEEAERRVDRYEGKAPSCHICGEPTEPARTEWARRRTPMVCAKHGVRAAPPERVTATEVRLASDKMDRHIDHWLGRRHDGE